MIKNNELYKCNKCDYIVEMIHGGACEMKCCDEEMELLKAIQKEEGTEKHIPIITVDADKIKIDIGEVPHPMVEEHWINFVELFVGDQIFRQELYPGDEPSVTFNVASKGEEVSARIYCNIHGLWPSN
ncbi:desulfoferrodoxin family protein [Methanobrevibacter sp. DSM 116169]|uniref:desulfoferrodoxin family protein n=1 Tax=Methanobrevibacter sp. DSM 116169 TaxID=3242727 RepID=UPI0038FC3405